MEKIVLHIDVNSAFLSWTAIDLLKKGYEDIRNIPSVIAGKHSDRAAIVLAKSIPAKNMGIKSAESLSVARSKCSNLKVFAPNYKLFKEMSDKLFNLIKKYTPDIEIASIDECYLDYGKVKNLYGDEIEFAQKLKNEIYNNLGFTVNIGIANNKLCAKMASDFTKPNRIHTLYDTQIKSMMYPLPIGDLFGVGNKTKEKLNMIGINTIGDLANFDYFRLRKIFKKRAKDLINLAKGIDDSPVNPDSSTPKGISNEITLKEDTNDLNQLDKHLFCLSQYIGERLRNEKKCAYVVNVILKDNYFRRINHQKKFKNPVSSTNEIYNASKELLNEMYNGEYIRLIGIRLDSLSNHKTYQTSLFEDFEACKSDEYFDKVIDEINKKYNKKIVTRASYIDLKRK